MDRKKIYKNSDVAPDMARKIQEFIQEVTEEHKDKVVSSNIHIDNLLQCDVTKWEYIPIACTALEILIDEMQNLMEKYKIFAIFSLEESESFVISPPVNTFEMRQEMTIEPPELFLLPKSEIVPIFSEKRSYTCVANGLLEFYRYKDKIKVTYNIESISEENESKESFIRNICAEYCP